jgi:hypothetical protein
LIWIELVISLAVPIGWGVWQLIDLRREARKDKDKAKAKRPPSSQ